MRISKVRQASTRFLTAPRYQADIKELITNGSMLDKLSDPKQSQMEQRYQLSKILVFYSLRELSARSPIDKSSDVILSVLTPGACKSDIFRDDASWFSKVMMGIAMAIVARTTEVGGRTLVHGISPKLPSAAHGRFLMDTKIGP